MARGRSSSRLFRGSSRQATSAAEVETEPLAGFPLLVKPNAATIVKLGTGNWQVDPPEAGPTPDSPPRRRLTELDPSKGSGCEVLVHETLADGGFRITRPAPDGGEGELHCPFGPALSDPANGKGKRWYQDGQLHRDEGPAVEGLDGTKEWWRIGELHRIGGPAIENPKTGQEGWYEHGVQHRVDGPAVTSRRGDRKWLLRGVRHRVGGPAVENVDGYKEWIVHGQRHRIGGPAIVSPQGREWWVGGQLHRATGPAVEILEGPDAGHREWWLEDRKLTEEEWQQERHDFPEPSRRRPGQNPGSIAAAMNRR